MIARILILALLMIGCSSTTKKAQQAEKEEPKHFEVVRAESQEWIGGRLGSGRGTIYQVTIRINKEGDYRFESMWKDKRSYGISTRSGSNQVAEPLKTDDLLLLRADQKLMYDAEKQEMKEVKPESKPPIKYEGAALIQYSFDRQTYYVPIDSFQQLEMISYP